MPSQYRHRRTSNPTAFFGTLEPGEIAVNTANRQIAVGDAASGSIGQPLELLAVRFFDQDAHYTSGDFVIQAGVVYRAKVANGPGAFTPGNWDMMAGATDPQYVAIAGSTMTGLLTLSGPPTVAQHAATKAYADTKLALAGGTLTGALTLDGAPVNPLHASTKGYTDTKVPFTGGTMTGTLTLAGPPANANDAATKAYVDGKAGMIISPTMPPLASSPDNSEWWDNSTGTMYILYNDGNSRQWVVSNPESDTSSFVAKSGDVMTGQLKTIAPVAAADAVNKAYADKAIRTDFAQTFTATEQVQAQNNIGLATLLRGYIDGLRIGTTAGAGSTTFTVSPGVASDSGGVAMMQLLTTLAKTSGSWSSGNNGGSLDTGAAAVSTWYHVFMIRRPDTGQVDICTSLSPTAPTLGFALPTQFTQFRRIGSLRFGSNSLWFPYTQMGDDFLYVTAPTDAASVSITNGFRTFYPLTVPTGIQVWAWFRIQYSTGIAGQAMILTSPDEADTAGGFGALTGGYSLRGVQATATESINNAAVRIRTDTQGRVACRASAGGSASISFATMGWTDSRGKDL